MYGEKYEDAIAIYAELGEYKDSKDKILEAKYLQAQKLYDDCSYEEAIEIYTELGEYKDSQEKVIEVTKQKELNDLKELLKSAYNKCLGDGATLSNDGLSLTIDGDGEYDFLSVFDVESVIKTLKLPDSLKTKMEITNSLMGRQTETYENIKVSWSYHPNNGLDAIFEIIIDK